MALTSSASPARSPARPARRHSTIPLVVSAIIAAAAIAAVAYLLWPTWTVAPAADPDRLPVIVGGTLFNVPTQAVRVKLQKRSGPQERVDLNFAWPSLEPPAPPRPAGSVEDGAPPIDRLFVSIAAHHDALSPDERLRTIYPRYLGDAAAPAGDGASLRAFRDSAPYAGEDLFTATSPAFVARCSRDTATPGMCLSERRVGGADLTFRFPRSWLAQWRDVAAALDAVAARMLTPRG